MLEKNNKDLEVQITGLSRTIFEYKTPQEDAKKTDEESKAAENPALKMELAQTKKQHAFVVTENDDMKKQLADLQEENKDLKNKVIDQSELEANFDCLKKEMRLIKEENERAQKKLFLREKDNIVDSHKPSSSPLRPKKPPSPAVGNPDSPQS